MHLEADKILYIKLGRQGKWETECVRNGILRFGYIETPHELCVAGDWNAVELFWRARRGDAGASKRDAQQIRAFYEATPNSLFITFHGGRMHWCRPAGPVRVHDDGGRWRQTAAGWSSCSGAGTPLTLDKLSGNLLKVQMFRRTICNVSASDYVLRKLNDEPLPQVAAAENAELLYVDAIIELMRLLTWQDFELLVDLVFAASGWRRIGVLGHTQKTVDIELILPTTGERAFVQVKSEASTASLTDYCERRAEGSYDRMFFVWRTGHVDTSGTWQGVTVVPPKRLATMILDADLARWLKEKVF